MKISFNNSMATSLSAILFLAMLSLNLWSMEHTSHNIEKATKTILSTKMSAHEFQEIIQTLEREYHRRWPERNIEPSPSPSPKEISSSKKRKSDSGNSNSNSFETPKKTHNKKATFDISPHSKGVQGVYNFWIDESEIPVEKRLDANHYFGVFEYDPNLMVLDYDLVNILSFVEEDLLELIKHYPNAISKTIYTGECGNSRENKTSVSSRYYGHKSDIKHQEKNQHEPKVRAANLVLDSNHNVTISYIIKNVPKAYLKHFEILVGRVLLNQEFGSTSHLGNAVVWDFMKQNYFSDEETQELLADKRNDMVAIHRRFVEHITSFDPSEHKSRAPSNAKRSLFSN